MIPTLVAYPQKTIPLFEPPINDTDAEQKQFEVKISKILPGIVNDLRQKRVHLIDDKSMNQIREGKVGFKIYNETNALMTYQDG